MQLRMQLQSTTTTTVTYANSWQLQWEKNSSGTWTDVKGGVLQQPMNIPRDVGNTFFTLGGQGEIAEGQSFLGDGGKLSAISFNVNKTGATRPAPSPVLFTPTPARSGREVSRPERPLPPQRQPSSLPQFPTVLTRC